MRRAPSSHTLWELQASYPTTIAPVQLPNHVWRKQFTTTTFNTIALAGGLAGVWWNCNNQTWNNIDADRSPDVLSLQQEFDGFVYCLSSLANHQTVFANIQNTETHVVEGRLTIANVSVLGALGISHKKRRRSSDWNTSRHEFAPCCGEPSMRGKKQVEPNSQSLPWSFSSSFDLVPRSVLPIVRSVRYCWLLVSTDKLEAVLSGEVSTMSLAAKHNLCYRIK